MPKSVKFPIHEAPASMPAKSCEVLVFCSNGNSIYYGSVVDYSIKHNAFCCHDFTDDETAEKRRAAYSDVKFWAYMDEVAQAICNKFDNVFAESQEPKP